MPSHTARAASLTWTGARITAWPGSADPAQVSGRAIDRGLHQVGSLGSGNHFLEVQAVDEIFDPTAAEAFGLAEGRRRWVARGSQARPPRCHQGLTGVAARCEPGA